MASTLAPPVANAWLRSLLAGDAQLTALAPGGVHLGVAPAGTAAPYVRVANLSSITVVMPGTRKLWSEMLYLVQAVDRDANYSALVGAANRIDTLLHGAPTQVLAGGTMNDCINVQDQEDYDPPVAGVIFVRLGARYKLHLQAP